MIKNFYEIYAELGTGVCLVFIHDFIILNLFLIN